MTLFFKDPLSIDKTEKFSSSFDSEWKHLPSSYTFNDLLNLDWS